MVNALFPGQVGLIGGMPSRHGRVLAPVIGGPITSVLILFEMAGHYAIILPLLVAVVNAMLVAHQFSRYSLYTHKLHEKGIDLVAGREESILKQVPVRDVMREKFHSVSPSESFGSLASSFFNSGIHYLYLTGEEGDLTGVISLTDLRPHLKDESLWELVLRPGRRHARPGGRHAEREPSRRPEQVRLPQRRPAPRGFRPAYEKTDRRGPSQRPPGGVSEGRAVET